MLALLLAAALPVTVQLAPAPDDPIGAAFGRALEQQFRADAEFPIARDPKDAGVVVLVITTPVTIGQTYHATAVSIALLKAGALPVYLQGSVKVIPQDQVMQRAREAVNELRAALRANAKSLTAAR